MKKIIAASSIALLLPLTAQAEQYWADNSISLLYGSDYKMIPAGQTSDAAVMTLEHVSGHSWGGVFLFIDRVQNGGSQYRETYSELSPTIYLKQFNDSIIKSINAEFTYEFGSSTTGKRSDTFSQDNYLAGVGLSWNIPGMDFFKTTIYHAWNTNTIKGDKRQQDDQLTLSYGWHKGNVNVDGFLDYTPSQKTGVESELNFTPQITYNIGPALGLKSKLKVGVEYAYWQNKFASTTDQNNLSLLLKWHL